MAEKTQVVARIDKTLVKRIDHLAVEWECFRQDAIARLIALALPVAEATVKADADLTPS